MAKKKPPFRMQEVDPAYQPGSYTVLGPQGHVAGLASGTSADSRLFRQCWRAWESLMQLAERAAMRALGLGEYAAWGTHPEIAVRFGNLANRYAKELFYTTPEGALLRAAGVKVTPDPFVYGGDFYHERWLVVFDSSGVSEGSVHSHEKYVPRTSAQKPSVADISREGGGRQGEVVFDASGESHLSARAKARLLGQGYAVIVRPTAARGFTAKLNCGLGRQGIPIMVALHFWEHREEIWKAAEMGLYWGQTESGKAVYGLGDPRLFSSALSRMPALTVLPYEYPVDAVPGLAWIRDITWQEDLGRFTWQGPPRTDLSCFSRKELADGYLVTRTLRSCGDFYWYKDSEGNWHLARWSCCPPAFLASHPFRFITFGPPAIMRALKDMVGSGATPPGQSGSGARARQPGPSGSTPAISPPSPPAKGTADRPPRDVPLGSEGPFRTLRVPGRHTVRGGENLSRIAARYYGNPSEWPKIYKFNRDVIGPNPHHLRKGVVLRLP
jgi:hypothetical protein